MNGRESDLKHFLTRIASDNTYLRAHYQRIGRSTRLNKPLLRWKQCVALNRTYIPCRITWSLSRKLSNQVLSSEDQRTEYIYRPINSTTVLFLVIPVTEGTIRHTRHSVNVRGNHGVYSSGKSLAYIQISLLVQLLHSSICN